MFLFVHLFILLFIHSFIIYFCPGEQLAKTEGYDLSTITGTGPGGRVIAADIKEFVPATAKVTEQVRKEKENGC